VKWLIALSLTLLTARVTAATAYVSDELVLGVYSEQNNQGQRLTTLHSGASVETLAVNGDFTQVRLNDGTIGWVKSAYLTTQEPAVVRIKQLQDELDRSRATTPALAEAAARSELDQLKRELAAKQAELMAANAALTPSGGSTAAAGGARAPAMGSRTAASSARAWIGVAATLASLMVGFCLGYATLARRIRHKYGGLKVY
jgi:Bacterial SH3 domain